MYDNPEQAKIAALIISIIILIIIIILIVIVCCNWNNLNTNTNTNANYQQQPLMQNPQALAAAAMYKNNQGMNMANAANAIKANPQKALLGAYAYQNRDNFRGGGHMGGGHMGGGHMGGGHMGGGHMGGGHMGGGQMGGQILNNIHNARNGGTGSDWANWIQGGQAKSIAQNKLQMYQNGGCPIGSHMTQISSSNICTASAPATCVNYQNVDHICVPNTGCPTGSHMTQIVTASNICTASAPTTCVNYQNVNNICVPNN
jgi:hypothetical protein